MHALALDIATKIGWACSDGRSGMMDLRPLADDYGRLGWALREWLSSHIDRHQVRRLVVERPFYRGAATTVYMLNGLAFAAQILAFERQLERAEYTVDTVRRGLGIKPIGAGSLKWKRGVMTWALAQGFSPESDDEADALALLTHDLERREAQAA